VLESPTILIVDDEPTALASMLSSERPGLLRHGRGG